MSALVKGVGDETSVLFQFTTPAKKPGPKKAVPIFGSDEEGEDDLAPRKPAAKKAAAPIKKAAPAKPVAKSCEDDDLDLDMDIDKTVDDLLSPDIEIKPKPKPKAASAKKAGPPPQKAIPPPKGSQLLWRRNRRHRSGLELVGPRLRTVF